MSKTPQHPNSESLTYRKSGVDPAKAAGLIQRFVQATQGTKRPKELLSGIGPFASCFSLGEILKSYPDPVLVTCCDGVGTKLKLAVEWQALEKIGQDLVAMNVNDLLCTGATPLLFLDYYACGKLLEDQWLTVVMSIQKACEESGCALVGGETAEMPGVYQGEDLDLAGFCVGIGDKNRLIGPQKVKVGDQIVGLASSGFHSNGYSLVRKVLEKYPVDPKSTVPWDSQLTWKDALIAPTHLYGKYLKPHFSKIHATAHITGGGWFENLPRVLPEGTAASFYPDAVELPPLFQWFKEKAKISTEEIYSTFNCGIGMMVILPENYTETFTKAVESLGLKTSLLGEIVDSQNPEQKLLGLT